MQKAPVMKGSGLAPIDDEPVHVFGRNLESRVVEAREDDDKKEDEPITKPEEDDVETIKKRKFDAITGEENEETVFQGEFKLFVWEYSTSNWIEKGRGQLKLNDDLDEARSRLIMRAGGTYRIILNVAIKHSLFKVIANTKTSIRFSDSQNVWAASGSNANQLADLLSDRIAEAANSARRAESRTKEIRFEGDKVTSTEDEGKNEKVEEEHKREGQQEKATRHSASRSEETNEKSEGKEAEETNQLDAEKSEDDSENDENHEEDSVGGSEENEPEETREPAEQSSEPESGKEVAYPDTTEGDGEKHHNADDETKRLKLSSD